MKRFRVVQVGCGSMARTWVEYALKRDDVEIVALVDMVYDNAKAMADRYNLTAKIYSDLTEAITSSGANLVFDVTIPESHRAVTTTALELGCDVFGEKPMGASLEDARVMVETAHRTDRTYAVMQNRRYNKQIRAFESLVKSDAIGTIGSIHADFFLGPHFGGFRDIMDHPLILDMAIHTFDQARLITHADPLSVYCTEFNPPGSWYKGNAGAICIFEMTGGIVFTYRGMWCAEGMPTSWESQWRVTGSLGTAVWDGSSEPVAEVVADPSETGFFKSVSRVTPASAWAGVAGSPGVAGSAGLAGSAGSVAGSGWTEWTGAPGHEGGLDAMFDALCKGEAPETYCDDNFKSVAMVYAAVESAKSQAKVAVPM